MSVVVAHDEVCAIAAEIFAALVDGEEGSLAPWQGPLPTTAHDVAAWVDVHGPWTGRASLETSSDAAAELARALLRLAPGTAVAKEDLVDALGEVANVLGGNVKALLPQYGTLGLPQVAGRLPEEGRAVQRVPLAWRGHSLVLTVWERSPLAGAADGWEGR